MSDFPLPESDRVVAGASPVPEEAVRGVAGAVSRLFVYPVKSCAGVSVREVVLTETGFDLDRAWMVVDASGESMTQRELPRMALVVPTIKLHEVVLRAPGMLALHLQIDAVEQPRAVRLWGEAIDAWDMGDTAAQWFSDFLARPGLRLVRFDPEAERPSNLQWTGGVKALNQFNDGYPVLALSEASLAGLNERLVRDGHPVAAIERFRPNLVIAGFEAHDEDRLETIEVDDGGDIAFKPVKPCPRCPIPNVDPRTAEVTPAVGDTLQSYRRHPALGGAPAFGMNLIALRGVGQTLRVGQRLSGAYRFD